jgi:hypothetical protein
VAIAAMSRMVASGWRVVVVGDKKTPPDWSADGIDFLSVETQGNLFGDVSGILPFNHYCRKNLGYLYAISNGAKCILETDDDNIPYDTFGRNLTEKLYAQLVSGADWVNTYKYFTQAYIWPRGLPLDEIASTGSLSAHPVEGVFPVQQYLADLDPDVDAVYRLVLNQEVTFQQRGPIALEKGCWTPFNSQNTVFYLQAFPLLYLPCHVSFRMTDIWRSFVIQQALWIFDKRVAFLPATVKQVRNAHNLMKDFYDEVPGYLQNKKIVQLLSECASTIAPTAKMPEVALRLWRALNAAGIVPDVELEIFERWTSALTVALMDRAA